MARAASRELPAAFDDFYRFTTTNPELRPLLGGNHEGLPKRLSLVDMRAMPSRDDTLSVG